MALRTTRRFARPKRDRSAAIYLALSLVLLGGFGWVLWKSLLPEAHAVLPQSQISATNVQKASVVETNSRPANPAVPPAHEVSQTNTPALTNTAPVIKTPVALEDAKPDHFPRSALTVLEAQVALARQAISPGSIDGVAGSQTAAALRTFQRENGLPSTGTLDADTRALLELETPPCTTYTVTSNDLARLQPLSPTWLGKSQQERLDYESLIECLAEMAQSSPTLLRKLNPTADWTTLAPGSTVKVPDVKYPPPSAKAAFVRISLSERTLSAFDAETKLLAFFPCSIAMIAEKRPVGELHATVLISDPDYTFRPEVFPESAEARELNRKLILPPGPNNPVGVAWIGLDKPGYGIHGTPGPEQVGRTESHGCFRLANWNAAYLLRLISVDTPVRVDP